MATGAPILNVMSFPSGKKQQYAAPPRPASTLKKKGKKSSRLQPKHSPKVENISRNPRPAPSATAIGFEYVADNLFEEYNPKDNIEVLVRVRPKNNRERVKTARTVLKILEGNTLMFDPKEDQEEFYFHGVRQKFHDCVKRPNKNMRFTFDHVYGPKCSNVEIFEETLKSIVNHIICGFSCSVFAYGATGSGKTYTMLGSHGNPGLTFLVAMELYRRISEMANDYESEVVVSYLEIYNETLRDLLRPSGILNIREDGLHGVNIPNLTTHRPKDPSEMLELLSSGNSARTQHPTDHNAESSRSHAVFQVSVTMRRRFTHMCLNYNMAKAKLVMVDLAGSERGSLGSSGEASRFREGANINKSLLALGNCINALADGKKHVPYRDSKLTRLLKDSLGGNCKTVMIANLAPTNLTYDDTYNTLKYADRAKQIRVHCKKNVSTEDPRGQQYGKMIADLQMEISGLKSLLLKERECLTIPSTAQLIGMAGDGKKCLSTSTISMTTSPLISQTQVINDPVGLENFIQLLGRKKKLDEALVKTSVKAKEAEWRMKWKNWRIDAVTSFSKNDMNSAGSSHATASLEKLRSLRNQYDSLYISHEECKDKMEYAKRVFNFNRKEIDLVSKNFLSTLKMDDPFLTVTLREFLYYKALEREVGSRKCIENYYQQMSSVIFDELLQSETIVASSINFIKYLRSTAAASKSRKNLQDKDQEKQYNEFLVRLCGREEPIIRTNDNGDMPPQPTPQKVDEGAETSVVNFPSLTSIQDLIHLIKTPVVEYEPPPTNPAADDSQSAESGIGGALGGPSLQSIMIPPPGGVLKAAESSSSAEYSTTTSSKEVEGNDEKDWVTHSSSTSDVHTSTCDLMKMLINSKKLKPGVTTAESKSSAPFTDPSNSSSNNSNTSLITTRKSAVTTNSKASVQTVTVTKKMSDEQTKGKWSGENPPRNKTVAVSKHPLKLSSTLTDLSDSAIPLKSVPATVSISLNETPRARNDKNMKPSETRGKDVLVPKTSTQNLTNSKKTTKDQPKHSGRLKTKFIKSSHDVSGKRRQNLQ